MEGRSGGFNNLTERVCVICGKEFIGNGTAKYCSRECREEGTERRRREAYRREKELVGTESVCPVCGRVFKRGIKRKLYCSDKCRKEGSKKNIEEGKNGAYRAIEGLAREWGVEGIKDPIAQLNEIARKRHMSYGEIKAELMIQRMKEGRG